MDIVPPPGVSIVLDRIGTTLAADALGKLEGIKVKQNSKSVNNSFFKIPPR